MKVVFRKMFHQLNNQYAVKQHYIVQYSPLNALYFYYSEICFHFRD